MEEKKEKIRKSIIRTAEVIGCLVLIFVVALLLFIAFQRFEAYKSTSERALGLEFDLIVAESKLEECQKYNTFQKAVSEIAGKGYSEDYDCYDHAKELQLRLEELGIESAVFISKDRKHAWLGVYVETVYGNFISPEDSFEVLEIRDGDGSLICQ